MHTFYGPSSSGEVSRAKNVSETCLIHSEQEHGLGGYPAPNQFIRSNLIQWLGIPRRRLYLLQFEVCLGIGQDPDLRMYQVQWVILRQKCIRSSLPEGPMGCPAPEMYLIYSQSGILPLGSFGMPSITYIRSSFGSRVGDCIRYLIQSLLGIIPAWDINSVPIRYDISGDAA